MIPAILIFWGVVSIALVIHADRGPKFIDVDRKYEKIRSMRK